MEKIERFTEENRETIARFVCIPVFLFNEVEVLCLNEQAEGLSVRKEELRKIYATNEKRKFGLQIKVKDEEELSEPTSDEE